MTSENRVKELRYIEQFAELLDTKFTLPGSNFRFGLDPIIGLIPLLGNGISLVLQGALVLIMARHGASGRVVALMIMNVLLDFLIGSIPILGNILDFFYKASHRNVKLLKAHYEEGKHQGSATTVIVIAALVLLTTGFLLVWGIWKLLEWLWHVIT